MKTNTISILFLLLLSSLSLHASQERDTKPCANIPNVLHTIATPSSTNFPTLVWLHGGGLTSGKPHLPLPKNGKIAQIAVKYRLLGKDAKSGTDCIEDAAAAVAWAIKNIHSLGGDSNKVFVAGMSAGAYLAMMVGMDPRYLETHGLKNTAIAGIIPISGQATKHFNVRRFAGDCDPQFVPKIDHLAPLAHVSSDISPILSICGQPPYEWQCRSEENRLLIASCTALGHRDAQFLELPRCNHDQTYECALPYLVRFIDSHSKELPPSASQLEHPQKTDINPSR